MRFTLDSAKCTAPATIHRQPRGEMHLMCLAVFVPCANRGNRHVDSVDFSLL